MSASAIPGSARSRRAVAVAFALGLCAAALWSGLAEAQGDNIVGRPRVIDGDTLDFAGTPVDLFGVDAPEAEQTCGTAAEAWTCGLEARWAALNQVGRHWVTCVPRGRSAGGNLRAQCYLAGVGQHDLGAWLVAAGWALADREAGGAYTAEEAAARAAGKGLWRGAFEAPWDWRRRHGGQDP